MFNRNSMKRLSVAGIVILAFTFGLREINQSGGDTRISLTDLFHSQKKAFPYLSPQGQPVLRLLNYLKLPAS
jgi:hypothetical protein